MVAGATALTVAMVGIGGASSSAWPQDDAAASSPAPIVGTATPETVAPAIPPTSAPAPRGIVLLTDPHWVLRVAEETGIPSRALSAYAGADLAVRSESGCAVGWNTLAAIGLVESEHGTLFGGAIDTDGIARPAIVGIALDGSRSAVVADTDGGAMDGDPDWDRAVGPMQFIPDTWKRWGSDGDEDGTADVHDIDDAALTAARYLCDAHGTLDGSDAWIGAIRSYNSDPDYQNRVAAAASEYASFG